MNTVLIIEDDSALRENLTLMLSMNDFVTLVAENGKTGLELARKSKPDIILCDIMLPDIDGYRILQELRQEKELAGIPFIFLTAKTEMADLRKGMNLGADDYLTKPFKKKELLHVIKTRLERHQPDKDKDKDYTFEGKDRLTIDDNILLNLNNRVESISVKTIELITAENIYSQIYTCENKKFIIRKPLNEWEAILPAKYFLRIHRSIIINLNFLTKIEKMPNSTMKAKLQHYPDPLKVGRSYIPAVKEKLFH